MQVISTLFPCRYGTGMIYYKQEKFGLAEMHYNKALAINPQSSVLLVHISVVSSDYHVPFIFFGGVVNCDYSCVSNFFTYAK